MKRMIAMLLVVGLVLPFAACKASEPVAAVPSDAERVVQLAGGPADTASEAQPAEPEYAQEHYAYTATAAEGSLRISAEAEVRYPKSLRLPVARVAAASFEQELASAYYHYFFEGKQPVVEDSSGEVSTTKQQYRDTIARYEKYLADGTVGIMTLYTEEELRQEIQRLEALIPGAPETVPPDVVSDGTMLPDVWWHDDEPEPLLSLNVRTEQESLHIYTPVNADDHGEAHFYYNRGPSFSFPGTVRTELAPQTSIAGMSLTWDEAMRACEAFLAVAGVDDMTLGKAYRLEMNGTQGYQFCFVRTVAGVPVALHSEHTRYKDSDTPWNYESLECNVTDDGICSVIWACPTRTMEIVNPAADAMPFAEAAQIFETMAVEVYDTDRYTGVGRSLELRVDRVELSLLRIRDISTKERIGLYVPAWIFFGALFSNGEPYEDWAPRVILAINAIDGSVINMQQGY